MGKSNRHRQRRQRWHTEPGQLFVDLGQQVRPGQTLRCSFCGKSQGDVSKLIAGVEATAYICNECIDICNEIITDDLLHPIKPI